MTVLVAAGPRDLPAPGPWQAHRTPLPGISLTVIILSFSRGGGKLLFLAFLWLGWVGGVSGCPAKCVCFSEPRATVACQHQSLASVPMAIPPHSQRIFLQNNRLTSVLSTSFSCCRNLTVLLLNSNNISHIGAGAFADLPRLEELDLTDNPELRTVSALAFRGLARLHTLHLHRCGLSELPQDVFRGLRALQYLYLQDNQLRSLHDHTFQDQANLNFLYLHNNRIATVSELAFRGLVGLDRLLLHQNRVTVVEAGAFRDLGRLTTLYLFHNNLTELSGEAMAPLGGLQYLRLNGNPWVCDCRARGLWDWFRGFQGSSSELECLAPPTLVGRDLKQLTREKLEGCYAHRVAGGDAAWPNAEQPLPVCCQDTDKSSIQTNRGRQDTDLAQEKGDMSGPRLQDQGRSENGTRGKHRLGPPGALATLPNPDSDADPSLGPTDQSGQKGRCLKGQRPDGQCVQGGASLGQPLSTFLFPLVFFLPTLWLILTHTAQIEIREQEREREERESRADRNKDKEGKREKEREREEDRDRERGRKKEQGGREKKGQRVSERDRERERRRKGDSH
ncbi:hypothetical protein JZ751_005747 [Albula glossodonta]|uniref:Uncharacterized protein n=1 Tax=Albula glossodonta TaxID=121402 RepID=A0A8T2N8T3_9TELE|nr:hypothetical protein JZ751_005747 [Albula glossodonta]